MISAKVDGKPLFLPEQKTTVKGDPHLPLLTVWYTQTALRAQKAL